MATESYTTTWDLTSQRETRKVSASSWLILKTVIRCGPMNGQEGPGGADRCASPERQLPGAFTQLGKDRFLRIAAAPRNQRCMRSERQEGPLCRLRVVGNASAG